MEEVKQNEHTKQLENKRRQAEKKKQLGDSFARMTHDSYTDD